MSDSAQHAGVQHGTGNAQAQQRCGRHLASRHGRGWRACRCAASSRKCRASSSATATKSSKNCLGSAYEASAPKRATMSHERSMAHDSMCARLWMMACSCSTAQGAGGRKGWGVRVGLAAHATASTRRCKLRAIYVPLAWRNTSAPRARGRARHAERSPRPQRTRACCSCHAGHQRMVVSPKRWRRSMRRSTAASRAHLPARQAASFAQPGHGTRCHDGHALCCTGWMVWYFQIARTALSTGGVILRIQR